MIGTLTSGQIDEVLRLQLYGRIACQHGGKLYVVPISYAFDGEHLYAHSKEGLKIEMLRKHPSTCFQTDIVDNLANWRSVIVWGLFEEINDTNGEAFAKTLLDDRFGPLHISESIMRPSEGIQPPLSVEKKKKAVYFRIRVTERTGRFERPE